MTNEEHVRIIEIVVQAANKRVPVIAGTGSNSTRETIEMSEAAKRVGADGLLLVTPYYNRPGQEHLYRHFKAVMEAVPLPAILYNVPGRTACDALPETIARLTEMRQLVGVKEATGSALRAAQIIARVGDRLAVLSGDDATTFPLLALGARGVISVVSNVAPALMSAMCDAAATGDWKKARELHYKLLPLGEGLFVEANPIPVKAALAMMGQDRRGDPAAALPAGGTIPRQAARAARRARTGVAMARPVRIAVLGADGRMGRALTRAVLAAGPRAELTAATERPGQPAVGKDAGLVAGAEATGIAITEELPGRGVADIWIDFTSANVTESVATTAASLGVGLVVGTTGLGTHARAALGVAATRIPVVYAANYSVGINVMLRLIADAARALGPDYDIEIVEAHHRAKRDAPSGTALTLADTLASASGRDLAAAARYARHGDIGARSHNEIGIQTLRGGDVVGDHTVMFLGNGDRLEITHRASTRDTFAVGAVRAALWLPGCQPGLYDMRNVLGLGL